MLGEIMKNRYIIVCVGMFFIACVIYSLDQNRVNQNIKTDLINEQGRPVKALLKLLAVTGIHHDESLGSIVRETQAAWIRKPGTERWDMIDTQQDSRDKYFDLFNQLHLIEEIKPQYKKYDYVLLMGCAYPLLEKRIQYLIDLWQAGIMFERVVILTGARPLTDAEKKLFIEEYKITESNFVPQTEADIMNLVYQKIQKPLDMQKVSYMLIDVPMKKGENGLLARPTTGDTVDLWLQSKPAPGSCLVISNQPYVQYQDSVVKTLLPKNFIIDTVGKRTNDTKISLYLDNLARYLYQEKQRLDL